MTDPKDETPVDPRAMKKLLKPWAKTALTPETSAAILEAVSKVFKRAWRRSRFGLDRCNAAKLGPEKMP